MYHFIADLLSIEKNGPMAEMWIGANRQGSAVVEETGRRLCDVLDEDPSFCGFTSENFPFLMKVLAIAHCLSIQCHPDAVQAKAGYAAEEEKRRTVDRKLWNYQDANQKAEMAYALTPMTAMCGFRPFEQAQKNADLLSEDVRTLVLELGDRYFGDPGVFSPLLMNIIHLNVGEAVYLKPRILHAYIYGNGVELMNNSDNVLRGGLTPKHVDLDELEKVMEPGTYIPRPMESVVDKGGKHFVCEGGFTLTVMENGSFVNSIPAPRILLCTRGEAKVNGELVLKRGECCIVGSGVDSVSVDATEATVFMSTSNNRKKN